MATQDGRSIYDKRKMQDIKFSEKVLWQQYRNLVASGELTQAYALINSNPSLKYKVFNAYNWNRLLNLVSDKTDTTDATYDSLEGKWEIDYDRLQDASEDFKFIGEYDSTINYKKNNLITFNGQSYFCTADVTNISPTQTGGGNYWLSAQYMSDVLKFEIAEETSKNTRLNNFWLKIIQ